MEMMKIFKIIYREINGLHQAVYVLALFTVGSQLLALVRDRLLANKFGAEIEVDLYYAAFQIPNLMFVLFASTLSVYVLIPFVTQRMNGGDASRAKVLLSRMFSLFLFAYTIIAFLLFLGTPYLVKSLFLGFSEHNETLILLTRILLLQPLFLGISSLYGVIIQLQKRFIIHALSPLIYNIGIIAGILFFFPLFGLPGLAIGVVLGAAGHLLIQIPFVYKNELAPVLTTNVDRSEIKSVLKTSVPRAITLSINQSVFFAMVAIASTMTVGSVAVFQLALNLNSAPLIIIGASYSVAAFPILAKLYSRRKLKEFRLQLITALRHIIFWTVPAIGLLIVLRAHIVRVILGSGEFDWSDTRLTAAALALFTISLTAQAVDLLLVRAFYAGGDTRTPFFISLASAVVALAVALFFYQLYANLPGLATTFTNLMRVESVTGAEVLILPFSYALSLCFKLLVLLFCIRRRFQLPLGWLRIHLTRAFCSALSGALAAYFTLRLLSGFIDINTLLGVFTQGFIAGVAGIIVTGLSYYLTGAPEFTEVCQSFRLRLGRVGN